MTGPTVLSPWYVVQRINWGPMNPESLGSVHVEYYTSMEESEKSFTTSAKHALLFTSLQQASRVASSEGAEVRVLTSKEEANEFGR